MGKKMWRRVGAAVGVLMLAVVGSATPAGAADAVTCGSTVTQSLKLKRDLHCPDGNGLVLRGAVSVDLGGHTLSSAGGRGTAITLDPYAAQSVRNGTVSGWDNGVVSDTASHSVDDGTSLVASSVVRVGFQDVINAVVVYGGRAEVSKSDFLRYDTAVSTGLWGSVDVDRSRFEDGDVGYFAGSDSGGNVTKSRFRGNKTALYASDGVIRAYSSTFEHNELAAYEYRGHIRLEDSVVAYSKVGFEGGSLGGPALLINNLFRNNELAVNGNDVVALQGNRFVDNATAVRAVDLYDFPASSVSLDGDEFTRNGDAIYATAPISIRGVHAYRNHGWGIYAPSATDVGSNVAYGNGNEPQCVGVTCASKKK